MADFTSQDAINRYAGTLGVDLRMDDAADPTVLYQEAIGYAKGEVLFYGQNRYEEDDLATSQFVENVATAFATEWLCERRLNATPETLFAKCERYRQQLQLVLERKAEIPGIPRSRRAVVVTNQNVDLRKANNQIRVDKSRSTGVVTGYPRVVDETAPDQR